MLWGKKTGGLYRLEGSVQTGGATVRHGSSGISEENGQGKQPLHRGTQSKRRGTWRIQSGTRAQGDALGYVRKSGQTRVMQPVQEVHREAQRKETKSILRSWRRDGATTTRKVTYFAAHPGGGCGAPRGGAEHLGEKVQALRCGGAYTSVGSGVSPLMRLVISDAVLQSYGELDQKLSGRDPNSASGSGTAREEALVKVPSKDPKKKDEKKDEDLSEEDLALKQQLELYVERVQDPDPGLQKVALESMRQEIRTSTSSMTSVPKPLKFLRPHYGTLKEYYELMADSDLKKFLADILSVLAMTMSAEGERDSLKYRLLGSEGDIGSWGHEYVSTMPEYEAVDLLMEVEDLDLLVEHVDGTNYKRTCLYLTSAARYLPGPDDMLVLDIAYMIYLKFEEYPSALQIALFLDNLQYVKQLFTSCDDLLRKKQFCYILARHDSLKYRLLGSEGDIGSWGHEYVRNLAGEIAQEYTKQQSEEGPIDDLMELVQQIVAFHMKHNAEYEAVDLLMEVEDLDLLVEHVDGTNYTRGHAYTSPVQQAIHDVVCATTALYLPGPDDMLVLDIAYMIYLKFEEYPSALQIALFLDNLQGITFELDEEMVADDEEREALQDIINNNKLTEGYLTLARDIEVMEPKSPEDIYKAHLLDGRASAGASVDSARQNLAATFVNAFVNAGFGEDKLMTVPAEASSGGSSGNWLFKNKEHGKASAAASLGMILLWDVDSGLAQIDKYFHSNDNYVIAGALLGVGIVNCGVKNDCDPAMALLGDYVDKEDSSIRIGAIMGLGLAYAGSQSEQIRSKLNPILGDNKAPLDVIAFTAISLGLVYVGSCNEEVAQAIIFALMDRSDSELGEPLIRLLPLGLGLLYLGKQDSVEATAEVSKTFNEKIRKYCDMTLLSCAYAGTGNVLKVQHLLGQCAQHLEKGESHQGPAVLGIAMVNVMDTLSRLSHDTVTEVAMAAVISLGLIGAGTNNARIAGMLRNLSSYYYKEASLLFCVRIAQGLVHLGKGLLTLAPYHSERFLLSPTALAGILTLLHACLDMKAIILGKYHYVLYFLALAMQPRMLLLTVDENLKSLSVPVRVGQAVDVVGQAGRPKTITGFQTHSTPVLLAAGDRAELATEKYVPLSPILEGFVILKENPEYHEDH
ncbi:26S proteasome regulatory subunit S2 1A [Actinidia rufa]|uniref:26S proteasome regulatory subunit S2 1A n=1 Tax=Actinidia rufa TaxID=165716 RepID=A0A7J0FK01_9ERIC|nr:26S proteasome regulatory subunit S2 1A [Actinidia rufa]